MRRPELPVLTTLRFPAAGAILLYHFLSATTCPKWVWEGFGVGVSFFYVLSGFILYYNYCDLQDRTFFWVARLARIWPVHLMCTLLALLIMPFGSLLGHAHGWITLPVNLLLIQAWLPFKGSALSYNGVAWSLSVEAFFYLSFPWLLVALKKRGPLVLLGVCFMVGLGLVSLPWLLGKEEYAGYVGTFNPLCRVFEFVLGMSTCHWWMDQPRLAAGGAWTFYELVAVAGVIGAVLNFRHLLRTNQLLMPVTDWLGTVACALLFALLIWVFAHQAGALTGPLSSRVGTWLGEVSFSLYMCHQLLLRRMGMENMQSWDVDTIEKSFVIYVTATLALSAALHHGVEGPMRHLIVHAYKRLKTSPRAV